MNELVIFLRLIHIVFGVLWAGWTFSMALFIEPAGRFAGPASGPFMQALAGKTPLIKYMLASPLLVVTSGIWMLWIVSGGFDVEWMSSTHGIVLMVGSISGLSAFVFGAIVLRPASQRMGALAAEIGASGGAPSPEQIAELNSVRERLGKGGRIAAVMLLVAVAVMAVTRYV